MFDLWDPKALVDLPHNPEGRFYVALLDMPQLGIVKGQPAYAWRSSLVFVVGPSHATKLCVLARPLDWDPESFSDCWGIEPAPAVVG